MVEYGTRQTGIVTPVNPNETLVTNTIYETRHVCDKNLTGYQALLIKNKIYSDLTDKGAEVLYMKLEGNEIITQFIFRKASLIGLGALVILGIIAAAILIFAVGFLILAMTIAKISPTILGPSLMIVAIGIALIGGALFIKYAGPTIKEYIPPKTAKT
jgi:hypothetical protein